MYKRGGAEEAYWAHNPRDGGSKPPLAKKNIFIIFSFQIL